MRRLAPLALLLPALAAAQPTPATSPAATATPAVRRTTAAPHADRDSLKRAIRDSVREAVMAEYGEGWAPEGRPQRTPRRVSITPALERTAFADRTARTLLARAREARMAQDSALRAYDAKAYQRLSVGMGFRAIGRERLLFRTENSARVRWSREAGVWMEPTGKRVTTAALPEVDLEAEIGSDIEDMVPVPYFPGRETLWIPSGDMGVARAEVDERDMLHPLANGAEAYYRYATGDSVAIRLPDGRAVRLRELRITARRPEWRAFVGSFWFDVERGNLVRAGYRMATEMDIWRVADEENAREHQERLTRALADTGQRRKARLEEAERERKDDEVPGWVKGMLNPMRANISAITVEYGLYEGRFWLPKQHVAEGEAQAGFMRMPIRFEERFQYAAVNAGPPVPRVPTAADLGLVPGRDSLRLVHLTVPAPVAPGEDASPAAVTARLAQREQRYGRTVDSLRAQLDSAVARGDSAQVRTLGRRVARAETRARLAARQRAECAGDSTYFAGTRSRFNGELRVAMRMPCDPRRLATSSDLPDSGVEAGEALFGTAERDALLEALSSYDLQPGWAPQPPQLRAGLAFARFNRIEGLSYGGEATSVLGKGYTASAQLRLGVADLVPNGELALARSNGLATRRLAVFHRLGVANDDWGAPLSFGASVANLLYGRDEGFYYRTWGAELTGARAPRLGAANVTWRLFAERQREARRELAQSWLGADFVGNIAADRGTLLGASGDVSRTWGLDPQGWRLLARTRAEAASARWHGAPERRPAGSVYGRGLVDATLSRGLGRFAGALTGAAGGIVGEAPAQRLFYAGGLQTVRGQFARPDSAGYVGDAFWLARAELGREWKLARPVVFYDVGWAGARERFGSPGRPLSGYGVGMSVMDGLVRADLSRGLWPQQRTRFDLSVEARF